MEDGNAVAYTLTGGEKNDGKKKNCLKSKQVGDQRLLALASDSLLLGSSKAPAYALYDRVAEYRQLARGIRKILKDSDMKNRL